MADKGTANLGNVLITGGTGTFGRAFARRVLDDGLAGFVAVYSRDEVKQHRMKEDFGSDPRLRFHLGDVRDLYQLRRSLLGVDTVVSAAAFKRVERSFTDFREFLRTNVHGTENVVEACHSTGVTRLVVLSSDKAVEPVTPYGISKSCAEIIAVTASAYGPRCRVCATRYGNVLGSRGSVLELWHERRDAGLPILVTDPAMTRFWMTIGEAVNLVLLALARMRGGEVFVPKGVPSSSVADLARSRFPRAGVEYVGKRAVEKVHERLVAAEEVDRTVDCGDVLVVLPHPGHVRWTPPPYGSVPGEGSPVPEDFQYRSGP